MNKTKAKILAIALTEFNNLGVSEVSIRQLASKTQLSHSNLMYHFPTKSEILLGLNELLLEQAFRINQSLDPKQLDIPQLYQATKNGFKVVFEFRFLFNDLLYICNSFPEMRKKLIEVEKVRAEMYRQLINQMIQNKLIRKEEFKDEYEDLIKRIRIFSDHWLVSASIYNHSPSAKSIDLYARIFMGHFYPYLTKKGKKDFNCISELHRNSQA